MSPQGRYPPHNANDEDGKDYNNHHDEVDEVMINEAVISDDDSDDTKLHAFAASPFRFSASASIYPPSLLPPRLAFVDDDTIDVAASTRSLCERYLDYREENGRRYCGEYFMPNDEFEQTRMYLNHQVHLQMLGGAPTTVPLDNPQKIIDIGCGTGEWVCQIGEMYPMCDVVGKDISAIQPPNPPHNVFFEIEDAEEPWLQAPNSVDLVHFREMFGAFRDWRFIYEQAFECIKPGGYIEVQETDDDGGAWDYLARLFPPDSEIFPMGVDLVEAAAISGRPLGIAHMSKELLEEAGFVDIQEIHLDIPLKLDSGNDGKIWLVVCIDVIEAMCLRLLTKYKGYDPEQCIAACERIAADMARLAQDPATAADMNARIKIITGRKPETPIGHNPDDYSTPVGYYGSSSNHPSGRSGSGGTPTARSGPEAATENLRKAQRNSSSTLRDDAASDQFSIGGTSTRGSQNGGSHITKLVFDEPPPPLPQVFYVPEPILPPAPTPIPLPPGTNILRRIREDDEGEVPRRMTSDADSGIYGVGSIASRSSSSSGNTIRRR